MKDAVKLREVAGPAFWQEISPGWSASDTRGCSFNANRTPEGCEDSLDRS